LSSRTGDNRKQVLKKTIGAGLVKLLEQMTGLPQPWGTLTGVRPTKLMHNLLLNYSPQEANEIIKEEFFVSEEKAELLVDVAIRQLKVIPDLHTVNEREVSIYIGIPFCPTKCA